MGSVRNWGQLGPILMGLFGSPWDRHGVELPNIRLFSSVVLGLKLSRAQESRQAKALAESWQRQLETARGGCDAWRADGLSWLPARVPARRSQASHRPQPIRLTTSCHNKEKGRSDEKALARTVCARHVCVCVYSGSSRRSMSMQQESCVAGPTCGRFGTRPNIGARDSEVDYLLLRLLEGRPMWHVPTRCGRDLPHRRPSQNRGPKRERPFSFEPWAKMFGLPVHRPSGRAHAIPSKGAQPKRSILGLSRSGSGIGLGPTRCARVLMQRAR